MLASVTRISLSLAFCSMFWACDNCVKYQDMVDVRIATKIFSETDVNIDSVVMKVNDTITTGCSNNRYIGMVGSKTHRVKFPINMRIQFFSGEDLWKELSFEMYKNTLLSIYKGECLTNFPHNVEEARRRNTFIGSFQADDYCWLLEKMDGSYDYYRCVEMGVGGPQDFCD